MAIWLSAGTAHAQQAQPAPSAAPASPISQSVVREGLSFSVIGLKRGSDGMVRLDLHIKNDSTESVPKEAIGLDHVFLPSSEGLKLLDARNGKRYFPLRDPGGECVCTQLPSTYKLESQHSIDVFIKFPAPPPSVKQISVELPGANALEDVAIAE